MDRLYEKGCHVPNTINYNLVEQIISPQRIGTYRNFFHGHTDQEIYGVYLWNKAICSSLYPLLQAVEISVRNAINNAAIQKYGKNWHQTIKSEPYKNPHTGQLSPDYNYINLKKCFQTAKKIAEKKEEKRIKQITGSPPTNPIIVDFNQVIAETDFKTWEYATHKCFFRVSDQGFLWPHNLKKAFFNWPTSKAKTTLQQVHNLISELRLFRNRVFHHEPAWKSYKVTTEKEAIKHIRHKINCAEKLIDIISPEKAEFLRVTGAFNEARRIATLETLDLYRYRTKPKTISLKRKKEIKKTFKECQRNGTSEVVSYAGEEFVVMRRYS